MPFLIIRNDITKVRADAIVNPANEMLRQGSGTSRAIYLAAGERELTEACKKIGRCAPGQTVATPAFRLSVLKKPEVHPGCPGGDIIAEVCQDAETATVPDSRPVKYIFHTVGPVWIDGNHGEEKMLYEAYRSAMALAVEYRLESMAFPLLSSGNYGFPKDRAFQTAVRAIGDFLMEHELMVYLVVYDREALKVSRKMFSSVEEYINDHYVEENEEGFPENRRDLSRAGRESFSSPSRGSQENSACFETVRLQQPEDSTVFLSGREEKYSAPDFVRESDGYASPGVKRAASLPKMQKNSALPKAPRVQGSPTQPQASKKAGSTLEQLLKKLSGRRTETFSQMLLRLIDERHLKDSYVYKKANVDRRHFSKIRNDVNYAPNKKTVLAFAIALELSMDETKDLMMRAGYAFSCCSKFDVIVCYYIENGKYDIFEINEALFLYGEALLGA